MPPRNNPFAPFGDPNSFLGRPFIPAVGEALAGAARSTINALTPRGQTPPSTMAGVSIPPAGAATPNLNPFPFLASLNPLAGTPLVQASRMQRGEIQQPAARAATLPSGAIMTGASSDIYPTTRISPSFPIAFDVTKTQTPFSQFSASTPQQITRTAPQQMQVPAQAPIFPTKPQEPRIDTAVREGTISATPQQLANFNARDTAFEGRTPAQQQVLLAQMRERGASLAAAQNRTMTQFAESRGPRFAPVAAPQGMYGQALTGLFPQSSEAIAQRTERNAPLLAATGFGRMQQEQQRPIQFGGRSPLYSGMGIGGVSGGPQPATSVARFSQTGRGGGLGLSGTDLYRAQQAERAAAGTTGPYSNARSEQRKQMRQLASAIYG